MAEPTSVPTSIELAIVRLEAKVDVALTQHGTKLEHHGKEISDLRTELRVLEAATARAAAVADHEQRLRDLTQTIAEALADIRARPSWRALGAIATLQIGLVTAAVAVINALTGG